MKYWRNCLWLTLPALLFNLAFASSLPEAFGPGQWDDVPSWLTIPENVLRLAVFVAPAFMRLSLDTRRERAGLALYLLGSALYFASWSLLIAFPLSHWSNSAVGFMAPAYTPLIWLMGIGLIGDKLLVPVRPKPWAYGALVLVFLSFHNLHAWLVYSRTG